MPKEFKPFRTEDNAFAWGSYEHAAAAILIARFVSIALWIQRARFRTAIISVSKCARA